MATANPDIITTPAGALKVWKQPWKWWRRRIADAAMLSHFIALKKTILLCASCEGKMPHKWFEHYGYRLLHNMHSQGSCTYCRKFESCNMYFYWNERYVQEWDAMERIHTHARDQQLAIRDKRRITGLD